MPAAPRTLLPSSIRLEGSGTGEVVLTETSLRSRLPSAGAPVGLSEIEEKSRSSEAAPATKVSVTKLKGLLPPTASTAPENNVVPPTDAVKVGVALQKMAQPVISRELS